MSELDCNFIINNTGYFHTRKINPYNYKLHSHEGCEIFILISGKVNYLIEKKLYSIQSGDLLILNSYEIHKVIFKKDEPCEWAAIVVKPKVLNMFNYPSFSLSKCFDGKPMGEKNKISLNAQQFDDLLKIVKKLDRLHDDNSAHVGLLRIAAFIEFLISINNAVINFKYIEEQTTVFDRLVPILKYIDMNLDSDLSLVTLSKLFFIDRSYISRIFKKELGITIHDYITQKRIIRVKELLTYDYNVTQVAQMAGFNDYANFLRTFKKKVGITPGKYKKNLLEDH